MVWRPRARNQLFCCCLRVFSPRRWDKFDTSVRGFMFIIFAFYFATSIAKICQCIPRWRIWGKSVPGRCVSLPALLGTSGLFNIISDVGILLVPLKGVWNLQMSPKRKLMIYAVFTVGLMYVLLLYRAPRTTDPAL